MASNTKNVKLGVCRVYFDGYDLGYTQGGVEVTVKTDTHKVNIDQFGKTAINEYIMGRECNVKCPMAETTIDNMVAIMPGAVMNVVGGGAAVGSILFNSLPLEGKTIIVNGITITFKATPVTGLDAKIGATTALTVANLANTLNLTTSQQVASAQYAAVGAALNITYGTPVVYDATGMAAAEGNNFTLGVGTSGAAVTLSGSNLAGGVDPTSKTVEVSTGIGKDLLSNAKELRLHPISKDVVGMTYDATEDFVMPLTATAGSLKFAYKLEAERIFDVEFNGYPDPVSGTIFGVGITSGAPAAVVFTGNAPTLLSAAIAAIGNSLVLTYNAALQGSTIPAGDFTISGAPAITVSGTPTVSGATVAIALNRTVTNVESGITISYTGSDIANASLPNTAAGALVGQAVTNNSTQLSLAAPTETSATVQSSGNQIVVNFSVGLFGATVLASDFAITGGASAITVSGTPTVSGSAITITTNRTIMASESGITLAYTGTDIKNVTTPFNACATFSGKAVTNNSLQTLGLPIQLRYFVAPANTAQNAAFLASMTVIGSVGVKAASLNVTTTAGNYGWIAVPASLVGGGVTFTDVGAGGLVGGWAGANSAGNNSVNPEGTHQTVSDAVGQSFYLFRQDYVNSNPTAEAWSIS